MSDPDPDQLLKSLDAAMAMARAKKGGRGANRNTFRILGIVILLIGVMAALAVLQYMVSEMAELRPPGKKQTEVAQPK
jgi:hypothetical protein